MGVVGTDLGFETMALTAVEKPFMTEFLNRGVKASDHCS